MIKGIGTDILNKKRIELLLDNKEDPFFKRIYTQKELAEAKEDDQILNYLSGRFAGKEAVFKTFKVHSNAVHLQEIEILRSELGFPEVKLHGKARELARSIGISKIELSLSHEKEYVIAYAIAIEENNI